MQGNQSLKANSLQLVKYGYSDKQTLRAHARDVSAMSDAELEAIARG